tara:strand:- start:261 stop:455 length:195 start_codon:yes stop_codon:yes gene_type:complete
MDVGELILQALLSMLCGALVYLWFLKAFIIPAGTGVFNISDNLNSDIQFQQAPLAPYTHKKNEL